MQFMADRFRDDLNAARRGEKMTFREMELNAEQEDAWKIMLERRQGQPLNAEQSLALRTLWVSSGNKLTESAKLVKAAPTEENQFAFLKMVNIHNAVAERSPMVPLFRNFREDFAAGGARQQLALARERSDIR